MTFTFAHTHTLREHFIQTVFIVSLSICLSNCTVDIVLLPETLRQVIMLKPAVPWEDRMREANEENRGPYEGLVGEMPSWLQTVGSLMFLQRLNIKDHLKCP